jgi:hypothetical protein
MEAKPTETEIEQLTKRLDALADIDSKLSGVENMLKSSKNGSWFKSYIFPILSSLLAIAFGFILNMVTNIIRDQDSRIYDNTTKIEVLKVKDEMREKRQEQILAAINELSQKFDENSKTIRN